MQAHSSHSQCFRDFWLLFRIGCSFAYNGQMKTRVVIIDSHTSVRQMLGEMLAREGGFDVAGEAGTGLDGLRICYKERPAPDCF